MMPSGCLRRECRAWLMNAAALRLERLRHNRSSFALGWKAEGGCPHMSSEPSICAVHDPPAHNRPHHFPRKLPTIKGRVVRHRSRFGSFKFPPLPGIEDGYVGEVAAGQRSASAKIEDTRWACGEEFDNAGQWN